VSGAEQLVSPKDQVTACSPLPCLAILHIVLQFGQVYVPPRA
jgi:hypothetical protein